MTTVEFDGLEIKKAAASLAEKDSFRDEAGDIKVPLKVLEGRPSCPHLFRHGKNKRQMVCKKASELAGYEIRTNWHRCRYDCPSVGGPYDGRDMTEEETGNFMYWMIRAEYKTWSPFHGIEKYIRKLVSNPKFSYPREAEEILPGCRELLSHPNVKTICAVGSLIVESVERPLLDFDLMAVVHDFDRYCEEMQEFKSILPQVHENKTDWFVGTGPAGTLAAVDLLDGTLHLGYEFDYQTGRGITAEVHHRQMGKWPEEFQRQIEEMKSKSLPAISRQETRKNWEIYKDTWRKGVEFTKSLTSGREVDEETYAQRHVSCHGTLPDGTVVGKPCMYRKESRKGGHYCGVCGCGDKKIANLSPDPKTGKSKLQFVHLRCPINAKGFSNE